MGAPGKNRILFVTPPYHCGVVELLGRWLPLGFVYLAAAARQAGLEAEIYDAMTKDHGYPEMEQRFRGSGAAYVAATAITSTVNDAIRTLELAKRLNPAVITILGGVHPTFCHEEVLAVSDAVDYIVRGEGENTMRELLRTLEKGGDPARVPGLAFRRDGRFVTTARRAGMEEIDDLPAAWDLLDWADYRYHVIPGARLGVITTSRCRDHDSILCLQRQPREEKRRFRDPRKVVEEMAHLHETYGVNVFLIADEHAASDRERWELFLDLLMARNIPIFLLMETRAPDVVRDEAIMWKYRQAGVIHMYIDIEGGNREAVDRTGNDPDVAEGKRALDIIHGQGIITETSFVIGFPGETRKSIERTLRLARYYNPDNAHFLAVTPWPYADMYEELQPYIRVRDYSRYNLIDPVIEPERMSLLQVEVALADCYRSFYMGKLAEIITMGDAFKRDYLMRGMRLIMGSSFIIKKLGLGTLGKVPARIGEMTAGAQRK